VATAGSRCFLAPNRKGAGDRHRDRYAPEPIKDDGVPSQYPRDESPISRGRHLIRGVAGTMKGIHVSAVSAGITMAPAVK